jgi:hypothetical protein
MSTSNAWPYNNTLEDNNTDVTTINLSSLAGSAGAASMIDTSTSTFTYPSSNVYVTSGSSSGLNWGYNDTISITSGNLYDNSLRVNGDAEITGKLKVHGQDIGDILNKIEQRLAILRPNPELESRWDELRELGERYRALEADLTEKELMWSKLIK